MSLIYSISAVVAESSVRATREYFEPIRRLIVWVRAVIRVPSLINSRFDQFDLGMRSIEKMVDYYGDQEKLLENVSREIRSLNRSLDSVRLLERERISNVPAVFLGRSSKKRLLAQQNVLKYLSVADRLNQEGNWKNAGGILQQLNLVSERHNLPAQKYILFNLGEISLVNRNFVAAQSYFENVVSQSQKSDIRDNFLAQTYLRLARVHYYDDDFDKTEMYSRAALKILKPLGDYSSLFVVYAQLASSLSKRGSSKEAKQALAKAVDASAKVGSFLLPE